MSKRKLLLADDSITIQKVVNLTFADEGIEVIAVGDGDSAMRKFDEFMPDLVMADVNMPGLNGYEVCRIIKRTEETEHIPVILLVGSFEPFDETEAKDAGADDFLTKPFQSIRQLVNKVTDLLNRRDRASDETQAAASAPVVDSFAETIEINREELPAAPAAEPETSNDFELGRSFSNNFENRPGEISSEFGDAGMDDEMIEASPATGYASDSDSVYQRETTIDYAKTQPLNAEDLKGFEMISGGNAEQQQPQSSENFEVQQPLNETREEPHERAEPASFDEEARKLNQTEDYENLESYPEPQNEEAPQTDAELSENAESRENREDSENISETEPQIDYYLPNEPEFEKELTDAETLAPDVSYENEPPREADFSQAEAEDSGETESVEAESASQTTQTQPEFDTNESAGFEQPENVRDDAEPENTPEDQSETYAANLAEAPHTSVEAEPEIAAESGMWEHPVNYSEAEPETAAPQQFQQPEETEFAQTESVELPAEESEADDQPEAEESEETVTASEMETAAPAETVEAEETAEAETIEAEETPRDLGTIDETPMSAAENAPALDFDDGDLLELPPLVEETGIRPQPKTEALVPEVVAAAAPVAEPEPKITLTKTVAESEIALSFPPELIEAIAQAVADKISAKTMSEVLPQITELVMKKLAEENQESKK